MERNHVAPPELSVPAAPCLQWGTRAVRERGKACSPAQPQARKVVSLPAQRPGTPRVVHLASSVISKTRRLTGPKSPCQAMTSSQLLSQNSLLLSYRSLRRARWVPTTLSAVLVLNVLHFPWNYSRPGIRVYVVRVKATVPPTLWPRYRAAGKWSSL